MPEKVLRQTFFWLEHGKTSEVSTQPNRSVDAVSATLKFETPPTRLPTPYLLIKLGQRP